MVLVHLLHIAPAFPLSTNLLDDVVSEMQAVDPSRTRRPAGKKRSVKRSAQESSDKDSDSSNGFEKMEVDEADGFNVPEEDQETDDGQQSTPQPLEEDNTTEDESGPLLTEQSGEESHETTSKEPTDRPVVRGPQGPPPRRELSFVRRSWQGKGGSTEQKPAQTADSDDDDDDDEL